MQRRDYLKAIATSSATFALAGCIGGGDDGDDESSDEGGDEGSDDGGENGSSDGDDGEDAPYGLSDGVVTIGSDIPYKPFEYRTEDGDLTGFDVAMAEAVYVDEMGLDYEFQPTGFDGIIPSLNNGNFRVIMSAMTINDTRAEKVDFSDPYFTAYQTIVVIEGGSIESKEDLQGKAVGVQKGTTGEGAAEELKEEFGGDLEIQSYDQVTGAFDALINNQVSAVVNDNTVNGSFVDEQDGVAFLEGEGAAEEAEGDAPPYLTLTVENYGIAFRQEDGEFRQAVNEALNSVKESGRYDEIYNEYFAG
ncbi:basic amino acid ABC transporter substrate-binding protein [Halovenus salina]|uniref:basic amino acid ABC transporter substrate-binding protein n=1 Tax=Halovenus salina TaxID=1510225 RepID=UPI0022609989|nr:basic amino acid ABC transporter substrate-binding protein [Halovenus salina]